MDFAFDYTKGNGGIDTEASYPYIPGTGNSSTCKFNAANIGATCTGFVDIPAGDEAALQAAVAKGPVSVAIDAGHTSFQLYKSGIYNERRCSSYNLDHGGE
jgi:cathepsin L